MRHLLKNTVTHSLLQVSGALTIVLIIIRYLQIDSSAPGAHYQLKQADDF